MKNSILGVLLLLAGPAFAQTAPTGPAAPPVPNAPAGPTAPALNFCGLPVAAPAGCIPESPYALRCDKYQLSWFYLNYGQLLPVVEEMVRTEKKKHKQAEVQAFEGFVLDMPAKGYRFSYATDAGLVYQLIFYGTAKGQPVVVQLMMDLDPEKTADLPDVARRIVRLNK